jgi:hypothetical protein
MEDQETKNNTGKLQKENYKKMLFWCTHQLSTECVHYPLYDTEYSFNTDVM